MMKLTPEQKAFFEYGKAVETLETRIERIRNNARIRFKMEYHELPLQFRGGLWDDFKLYNVIGDVRRKRAVCRAVIVSNDCIKCIRFPNKYPGWKCPGCEWATFTKTVKSRWEPRKEGE